jgi:hypothetical protein
VVVRLYGLTVTGGRAKACPEWDGYVCGGGIRNHGTLTLEGVTVRENRASAARGYGGGIYNGPAGVLTLLRSTVSGNLARGASSGYGGGIGNDGRLTVRASTISGNTALGVAATGQGGGIYSYDGTTDRDHDALGILTLANSTLSGNRAQGPSFGDGGGLYDTGESAVITSSTISDNVAVSAGGSTGGGVVASTILTLGSSLIARNTADEAPDCRDIAASAGFNLIGKGDDCGLIDGINGDQVGSIAAPIAPRLGPLAANGGPTKTQALLTGSPARNAAGPAPCDTARDQRGVRRPQGAACDIGAYERR